VTAENWLGRPPAAARVFRAARAHLAECPVWGPDGRLTWVDAFVGEVHVSALDAAPAEDLVHAHGGIVGSVIPVADGTWVIGLDRQVWLIDAAGTHLRRLAEIDHPHQDHHLNDAKADPLGRLVIGSVNERHDEPTAGLFQLIPDGYRELRAGMRLSNGLDWSPDERTFYYTDSDVRLIFAAEYHEDGTLTGERVFTHVADGLPDGLAVDAEGCVWSAVWGAGRVERFAPDGRSIGRIRLPAPHVTSVTFGGPSLATLFVTTARDELGEQELRAAPQSGSLFAIPVSVPGQPVRLLDPAQLPGDPGALRQDT
jgi:sugar lactone lactonase YvrE